MDNTIEHVDLNFEVPPGKGYILVKSGGGIKLLTRLVNKAMGRILSLGGMTVRRPQGSNRGFSFHWSNAQAKWDVISANDSEWMVDGAEVLVYFDKGSVSPVGKPWTLAEMRYVAAALDKHPGFEFSVYASESKLRSKLIRLAHAEPSLRPHLLPILKEAGDLIPFPGKWHGKETPGESSAWPSDEDVRGMTISKTLSVGDTVNLDKTMLQVQRFRPTIRVTDMTDAGKRGKKVRQFSLYDLDRTGADQHPGFLKFVSDILGESLYFDAALKQAKDLADQDRGPKLEVSLLRGVDVLPMGFKAIVVDTWEFHLEVDLNDFVIRDKYDQNNFPTCIPAAKGGKRDIPVFYRWVRDNIQAIEKMTFSQIVRDMMALGIKFHQYCAMD